jgi:cell surface protein
MNKLNKIVLALFVGLLASVTAVAQSDFNTGGLFYKITDAVNHKVSVVPENATSPYYTTAPSGNIVIPATVINGTDIYMVETIADHAFDGCTGITSIKLSTATPYVINANVFEGLTLSGIKLIVPQAAKAAYKAAAVWSGFKVVGDAQHVITITPAVNGTLTVSNAGVDVPTGTSVDDETVLTVTATAAPDYQVDSIKVGDQVVANGGTFTVTDAVTIAAFVSKVKYAITFTNPANGTLEVKNGIAPITSGDQIEKGTVLTVSATADPGYRLDSIKVGDVKVTNGGTFTVTNAVTIKAFVSQIPSFVITINQPANGTLEVKEGSNVIATGSLVLEGTVLTVSATANTGYKLDSIKVGNAKVVNGGTFTVTEAVTVTAFISQIPPVTKFKVSYNPSMQGGQIRVINGIKRVANGDSVAQGTVLNISVTTNPGYTVKSLKVNGASVSTSGYSHTVNADVLIEAEFSSMTDIENVSATATKVYPNPVVDRLNVETEEDVLYIRVYNMYGVEVARIANANVIDLASLAAGNYLVRVQTATGVSTHRIVKK